MRGFVCSVYVCVCVYLCERARGVGVCMCVRWGKGRLR